MAVLRLWNSFSCYRLLLWTTEVSANTQHRFALYVWIFLPTFPGLWCDYLSFFFSLPHRRQNIDINAYYLIPTLNEQWSHAWPTQPREWQSFGREVRPDSTDVSVYHPGCETHGPTLWAVVSAVTCRAVWRAGSLPCQLTVCGEGEVGEGEGLKLTRRKWRSRHCRTGFSKITPSHSWLSVRVRFENADAISSCLFVLLPVPHPSSF